MTISNEKVVSLVYQLHVDDKNGDVKKYKAAENIEYQPAFRECSFHFL